MKNEIKIQRTTEKDCIFCKILRGELPSTKYYEDDDFVIIKNINPQAKIHLLAIIKQHIPLINELDEKQASLLGKILFKISHMATELGLTGGYRIQINQGENGGQTISHLHIHILGGEKLPE